MQDTQDTKYNTQKKYDDNMQNMQTTQTNMHKIRK